MWMYTARLLSKKGGHVFQSSRVLTDEEYANLDARVLAVQITHDQLRNIEGYTPDLKIEPLGWREWTIAP